MSDHATRAVIGISQRKLATRVAVSAGWQEIKNRDEEAHTKVLWNQLTGTNDLSSLAECIEKKAYGMDIEKCVGIEAAINKTLGP